MSPFLAGSTCGAPSVSLETFLPAIKYPVGVSYKAGCQRGGVNYYMLPSKDYNMGHGQAFCPVPEKGPTAGPCYIRTQNLRYMGEDKKGPWHGNGNQWSSNRARSLMEVGRNKSRAFGPGNHELNLMFQLSKLVKCVPSCMLLLNILHVPKQITDRPASCGRSRIPEVTNMVSGGLEDWPTDLNTSEVSNASNETSALLRKTVRKYDLDWPPKAIEKVFAPTSQHPFIPGTRIAPTPPVFSPARPWLSDFVPPTAGPLMEPQMPALSAGTLLGHRWPGMDTLGPFSTSLGIPHPRSLPYDHQPSINPQLDPSALRSPSPDRRPTLKLVLNSEP